MSNDRNLAPASEQIIATTTMAQFSVSFSKTEGADFPLVHLAWNYLAGHCLPTTECKKKSCKN